MASGKGRSYPLSRSYRPVPGVRKSGIPAEQLAPAPTRAMILECSDEDSRSARTSSDSGSSSRFCLENSDDGDGDEENIPAR